LDLEHLQDLEDSCRRSGQTLHTIVVENQMGIEIQIAVENQMDIEIQIVVEIQMDIEIQIVVEIQKKVVNQIVVENHMNQNVVENQRDIG
jgi:uncharacterized protein YueI